VLALLIAAAVIAAPLPTTPTHPPATLEWPAQGTVTTPFGLGGHPGIDIGILRSLTVRAAATGRVTLVGRATGYEGYGNVVVVSIGDRYSNLYAHLATIGVRRGEIVTAGEPLGVAGCTGWCTGTHLHFELRLHGIPVDPARIPFR
jgi:murein DD-endopeptidase MepM/ murein hydrolase activator NlpD